MIMCAFYASDLAASQEDIYFRNIDKPYICKIL